ncbi:unnamed protein product [Umbelopsis vinacea]
MTSSLTPDDEIKSWFNTQAPEELSLSQFQSFFPIEYRACSSQRFWMDYRAHYEHVMKVIDNEIEEEMVEREAGRKKTPNDLDDINTALANLARAERELDHLNDEVQQDIQKCEAMILMKHQEVSSLPDLESNGTLQKELAMVGQKLKYNIVIHADITTRRESISTFKAKPDLAMPSNSDTAVSQLLGKLDEAAQTIANLRSILTFKTAELNELVGQLELTNQAIQNVETTTADIETMLTEMGLSLDTIENNTRESMLLNAQASLDHALKSANNIYANEAEHNGAKLSRRRSLASSSSGGIQSESSEKKERMSTHYGPSKIRYKPDSKPILRQLHELIRQLGLDSAKFFQSIGSTDDVQKLQKAYVDLEIAKTISLAAKTNMKRRTIMLRRVRRRDVIEEVDLLGIKIREAVAMWQEYTHFAPLLVDGKDILDILDREDDLISKNHSEFSNAIYIRDYSKAKVNIVHGVKRFQSEQHAY